MNLGKSVFLIVFLVGASASLASGSIAVAPDQAVAGLSQAEWSRAWWQWAGSFDVAESPVSDPTGTKCGLKQQGPVWFLAGTYGTKRTIRVCTLPHGKYVFFPLVNYVVMPSSEERATCESCCASKIRTAESVTDEASYLVVDLDGQRIAHLERYRQATKACFDMGALTDAHYRVFPSAANGYYVMLRPLTPGKHVLNFGGILPSISQAVTYTLMVK